MVITLSTSDQKQFVTLPFVSLKTIKLYMGFAYVGISKHRRFFHEWLLVQIKGQ